ncbi:hypothetical protein KTC96_02570 [Clostridium estertheticum]|uniref:tetratricopeptide repeat protein n=1 Tax=Clostridium estertheticum TaxID=238834 RepID=UPI001C7D5FDA|nr:hypothetical protein [Clostridium estertheticum]MBX4261562.1 hypothetical protein [Clostridium estertheticum]WLC70938.1 hypothetical protein KTC96_02570 [Clostridium estertheticum]
MSIKNKVLISSGIILVIVFLLGSYYYLSKVSPYNQFSNNANQAVIKEEYDKAVTLYGEALSYKKDPDINKKIDVAKLLKKSKETYAIAVNQMKDKDYLTAIDTYKKVAKQDTKRYSDSQNSISNCKKLYIADNLKNANDNITNKKFDEANKYIGNITKLDANNTDVKKLKADIVNDIQKQKDDAVATKSKIVAAAKAEKEVSKLLTVDQAKNILKTYKSDFPKIFHYDKYSYYYNPDSSYVNSRTYSNYAEIRNNYYIFNVSEEGSDWDSNMCVNKKTGGIYVADPSGTFMTLNNHDARTAKIMGEN